MTVFSILMLDVLMCNSTLAFPTRNSMLYMKSRHWAFYFRTSMISMDIRNWMFLASRRFIIFMKIRCTDISFQKFYAFHENSTLSFAIKIMIFVMKIRNTVLLPKAPCFSRKYDTDVFYTENRCFSINTQEFHTIIEMFFIKIRYWIFISECWWFLWKFDTEFFF